MIGYRISKSQLEDLIEAEKPGWLRRAKQRTKNFVKAGAYSEDSSIWSEIKGVYIRLQGDGKCVYCERKLEGEELGKVEHDVEHFRPKSRVRAWTVPKELTKEGVHTTAPTSGATGYYKLSYHLFNYSTACKTCNSTLKSDFFPIAGTYKVNGGDPQSLRSEKPLLIYPLGDFDVDPESLIRFHGVSPQPVAEKGHDRHRALTTIAFFALDDTIRRKNLVRERAVIITALFPNLENLASEKGPKVASELIVKSYQAPTAPHANCARSFVRLYNADKKKAATVFELAAKYLESIS